MSGVSSLMQVMEARDKTLFQYLWLPKDWVGGVYTGWLFNWCFNSGPKNVPCFQYVKVRSKSFELEKNEKLGTELSGTPIFKMH